MSRARIVALVPLAVALAVTGTAGAGGAGSTTTKVSVKMTDFAFALSKKRVPAGTVVFRVVNSGEIVHDFRIAGKKTPIYETGESGVLRVRLAKPGEYGFVCTVPGHVAAGMKGTLKVTG